MVLAVKEEFLPRLKELADIYETELPEIGDSDDSGILKVWHNGELVCELDNSRLHDAPIRQLKSSFEREESKNMNGLKQIWTKIYLMFLVTLPLDHVNPLLESMIMKFRVILF